MLPDWANFESSWRQLFSEKKPKYVMPFWALLKNIIFLEKNYYGYIWQILEYFGLLFIPTSGHTGWPQHTVAEYRSGPSACFKGIYHWSYPRFDSTWQQRAFYVKETECSKRAKEPSTLEMQTKTILVIQEGWAPFIIKIGQPRPLFRLSSVCFNPIYNLGNKLCKNVHWWLYCIPRYAINL